MSEDGTCTVCGEPLAAAKVGRTLMLDIRGGLKPLVWRHMKCAPPKDANTEPST